MNKRLKIPTGIVIIQSGDFFLHTLRYGNEQADRMDIITELYSIQQKLRKCRQDREYYQEGTYPSYNQKVSIRLLCSNNTIFIVRMRIKNIDILLVRIHQSYSDKVNLMDIPFHSRILPHSSHIRNSNRELVYLIIIIII